MERVKLSKNEKRLLWWIFNGQKAEKHLYTEKELFEIATPLIHKGFLQRAKYGDGDLQLTKYGKVYFHSNPKLRNPINWQAVNSIGVILTAIVAIIALLTSCGIITK